MTARQTGGADGAGRRPSTGAQRRTAEARRCPTCNRGGALVSVKPRPVEAGETTTYCRWDDCTYARVVPFPETVDPNGRPLR